MKKIVLILSFAISLLFANPHYTLYKGYHPAFGKVDLQLQGQEKFRTANILFSKDDQHQDMYVLDKGDTLQIRYPQSTFALIKGKHMLLNWKKGKKTYKIRLKESLSEFKNLDLKRSERLDPDNPNSPEMNYELYAAYIPQLTIDDSSNAMMAFADPSAYFDHYFKLYSKDYQSMLGLYAEFPGSASLNYEYTDYFEILYQDKNTLSLRHKHVSFTGGAHPNSNSTHWIIDRKTFATIGFDEFFIENSEKEIKSLIDEVLNKMFSPNDIETVLFSRDYPVSKDIYLTKKGMVFQYDPYEIACYAQGPIEVFVSYSKLKAFMK